MEAWGTQNDLLVRLVKVIAIRSRPAKQVIHQGRGEYIPFNYHDLERLFSEELIKFDIVVTRCSPPDKHGYVSTSLAAHATQAAFSQRGAIKVLEIHPMVPFAYGNNHLHLSQVDYIIEDSQPLLALPPMWPTTPETQAIASYVTELVEDGSTIQFGLGGIASSIGYALEGKRDLGIHTEHFTDSMMHLMKTGVVTNAKKTINPGKTIAQFLFGTMESYQFIDHNPAVEIHQVSYTNDPSVIAQHEKMVSINSTLEVDLTGQCASEAIGPLQWTGTGGQVDFARGAWESKGGKSFLVLQSTARRHVPVEGTTTVTYPPYLMDGDRVSTITPYLTQGAIVTTPRQDVSYVVTEYGVAFLRGKSVRQRAEALTSIAHPDFRAELRSEARRLGLL